MRIACIVAAGCVISCISPAWAIFNVNPTTIKKGVLGLESRNRLDDDDRTSKDHLEMHALKSQYGITDRWAIEMQNTWQDTPQHGYEYLSSEFENKFRFYDPGAYWLDFALKLGYEWKNQNRKADQVKSKFLFAKKLDKWSNIANLNLSKEIGSDAVKDTELSASWQTQYALNPHFNPGFEVYSSLGEIADMPNYSEQEHRIGPMFFGTLAPGLSYQAGYLFGVSQAATDGSFKLFLKYEFPL